MIKTHSCWDEPIYREPLDPRTARELIEAWHRPYHEALTRHARNPEIRCGLDGHTMASHGPPHSADEGRERPFLCVSDGDGTTCPRPWVDALLRELEREFGHTPAYNEPFSGGYVVRHHAHELPWIQLEFSRAAFATHAEKRAGLLAALTRWCRTL